MVSELASFIYIIKNEKKFRISAGKNLLINGYRSTMLFLPNGTELIVDTLNINELHS